MSESTKDFRAVPADILHFPARVVDTLADAGSVSVRRDTTRTPPYCPRTRPTLWVANSQTVTAKMPERTRLQADRSSTIAEYGVERDFRGRAGRRTDRCAADGAHGAGPCDSLRDATSAVRSTPGRSTGSDSRADAATADWITFRKQCRTAGACAAGARRLTWERDGHQESCHALAGRLPSCVRRIFRRHATPMVESRKPGCTNRRRGQSLVASARGRRRDFGTPLPAR